MTFYCHQCGHENSDDDTFCTECGTARPTLTAEEVPQTPPPPPPLTTTPTARRRVWPRIAIAAAAAVALLAGFLYVVGRGGDCSGEPGPGDDFSGCDLSGEDLTDADLAGVNLTDADLTGAKLSRLDLIEARLHGANLTEADLTGTGLVGADLAGARLTDADLSDADLTDADLTEADLSNANLANATAGGADTGDATLTGADLTDTALPAATLTGAQFDEADLSGADLHDADLSGANLSGATVAGADLSGASLSEADLAGTDLATVANVEGARGLNVAALAEGLGVERAAVAATLDEADLNLESRLDIVAAVEPVCAGNAVEGAGTARSADFDGLIVLRNGQDYFEPVAESEVDAFEDPNFPAEPLPDLVWEDEPRALRFVELVGCIGDDQQVEVNRCTGYVNQTTGEPASDIIQYEYRTPIDLIDPETAEVVQHHDFVNSPGACPGVADLSQTEFGAPATDEDIFNGLPALVAG